MTKILDVRPVLAKGGHPLDEVLSTWAQMAAGETLTVIAPFEPAPMMILLSAQGATVACRRVAEEEYHLLVGPKAC